VSTLGGNVAENAGGLLGLKYGVTRDYVMGLQFSDMLSQAGDRIAVKHPVEIYAESFSG
jgi:FAD/FMN-containing dehydrogenase